MAPSSVPRLRLEPRRWQKEAQVAWRNADMRGVVEVITGAGKTVFAEMCITQVLDAHPNSHVLIVVPTIALLDQWYVSLQEELGLADTDLALFSGRSRTTKPRLVNIMVLNTARTRAATVVRARPTFLIVDECHRAATPVNAAALVGEFIATLGMSATPERDYDEGFREHIVPALGSIVYRYDLNDAGADGILSRFRLVNVAVDLLPDERQRYDALTRRVVRLAKRRDRGDDVDEPLKVLLRKRARESSLASMRVPVAVALLEQHRGVRAMVFHEEIREAERILALLKKRGHSATIYHSRIGSFVRRDNLRLYRRGVFDVLVSCRALDEGVNIPETRVAIIASATASTRQRVQRLGRVLRPAPGKRHAEIYTIYATMAEERRLTAEAASLAAADSVEWRRGAVRRA